MIRWSKIIILAHTLTAVLQSQKLIKADQCENQTFIEVVIEPFTFLLRKIINYSQNLQLYILK